MLYWQGSFSSHCLAAPCAGIGTSAGLPAFPDVSDGFLWHPLNLVRLGCERPVLALTLLLPRVQENGTAAGRSGCPGRSGVRSTWSAWDASGQFLLSRCSCPVCRRWRSCRPVRMSRALRNSLNLVRLGCERPTLALTLLLPRVQEMAQLQGGLDFQTYETGYSGIHKTKPQTLGYGLTDSPVGARPSPSACRFQAS